MRIAHLVWGMNIGGIENMLVDLANEQVEQNGVSIIVINDLINEQLLARLDKRVRLVLLRRRVGSRNPLPLVRLNLFLMKWKPTVVHYHDAAISCYVIGKYTSIATIHNTHLPTKGYSRMQALVAISESVRQDVKDYETQVIHNGIDFSAIACSDGKPPSATRRIVQIGRLLCEQKGQDLLIEAVRDINVEVDIIGEGEDREYLQKLIDDYGLADRVRLLGGKDRTYIYSRLCDYDLFVQPSRFEGFGLTVIEAMAAGVPVLVSDIEGPMEIIKTGKYGYHFKCGDSQQLAKAIHYIISNYDDCSSQTEEVQKYVRKHYSIKSMSAEYGRLYKSITFAAAMK